MRLCAVRILSQLHALHAAHTHINIILIYSIQVYAELFSGIADAILKHIFHFSVAKKKKFKKEMLGG